MAALIICSDFGAQGNKIRSLTVSIVSPSICHEVMGPDAMILVFWMLSLSQLFHSPLSLSSRGSLVLLCFLPLDKYCAINLLFYNRYLDCFQFLAIINKAIWIFLYMSFDGIFYLFIYRIETTGSFKIFLNCWIEKHSP